jgi:hypothetical protein
MRTPENFLLFGDYRVKPIRHKEHKESLNVKFHLISLFKGERSTKVDQEGFASPVRQLPDTLSYRGEGSKRKDFSNSFFLLISLFKGELKRVNELTPSLRQGYALASGGKRFSTAYFLILFKVRTFMH